MEQIPATITTTTNAPSATDDQSARFLAWFESYAQKRPSIAAIRWGVYYLAGERRDELHSGGHALAEATAVHGELQRTDVMTYIDADCTASVN